MPEVRPLTRNIPIGSARYREWRASVVLEFSDYTFTRHELNAIGVGLHLRAAASLSRVAARERWSLGVLRTVGMKSLLDVRGIGEVSLIVLSHCLVATYPSFDVQTWIGRPIRTIAGGVRAAAR